MANPQYLYIIGPKNGPYKIGIATSPKARLANIQTGSPVQLYMHWRGIYPDLPAGKIERRAHLILKSKRIRGEWFNVTKDRAREAIYLAAERIRSQRYEESPDQRKRRLAVEEFHHHHDDK